MPLSPEAVAQVEVEFRNEFELQYALSIEDEELAVKVSDIVDRIRSNKNMISSLRRVLKEAGVDADAIAKELRDAHLQA